MSDGLTVAADYADVDPWGAYYTDCPECKGSGMNCDDDFCDEVCWYCHGCGYLRHCVDDLCAAMGDDWCDG